MAQPSSRKLVIREKLAPLPLSPDTLCLLKEDTEPLETSGQKLTTSEQASCANSLGVETVFRGPGSLAMRWF